MNPTRADNLVLMDYAIRRLQDIEAIGEGYVQEVRIAGGAARDSHLDVPIRDVDILISFKPNTPQSKRQEIIREAFDPEDKVEFSEDVYGMDEELFARIHSASIGYAFEFIEIPNTLNLQDYVSSQYPDNISRITVDSQGRYWMDPTFTEAIATQRIVVEPGHAIRANKLRRKFPEYTIVVQEDYTEELF